MTPAPHQEDKEHHSTARLDTDCTHLENNVAEKTETVAGTTFRSAQPNTAESDYTSPQKDLHLALRPLEEPTSSLPSREPYALSDARKRLSEKRKTLLLPLKSDELAFQENHQIMWRASRSTQESLSTATWGNEPRSYFSSITPSSHTYEREEGADSERDSLASTTTSSSNSSPIMEGGSSADQSASASDHDHWRSNRLKSLQKPWTGSNRLHGPKRRVKSKTSQPTRPKTRKATRMPPRRKIQAENILHSRPDASSKKSGFKSSKNTPEHTGKGTSATGPKISSAPRSKLKCPTDRSP